MSLAILMLICLQIKQNLSVDPSTVILGSFDDLSRRNLANVESTAGSLHSGSSTPSIVNPIAVTYDLNRLRVSPPSAVEQDNGAQSRSERSLIQHYRTVVRRHLAQTYSASIHTSDDYKDCFETEAERFPPV